MQTETLAQCIEGYLLESKKLVCEDRMIKVHGDSYDILYCIEGYGKHCDSCGYIESGKAKMDFLHRMSYEDTMKYIDTCDTSEREDIYKRMYIREWKEKYPNPADRLTNSCNYLKQQKKLLRNMNKAVYI